MSRYQKGKTNLDFTEARDSGISWAICKSAPSSRQITTPTPHHSVFTGRMPFLPPNQQRQSTEGMFLLYTHTRLTALYSRTTQVSRYQKGKPIWILLKQETVSGSCISRAICKSAPCSRQIATPAPHHSVFYRPDALPSCTHVHINIVRYTTV